jgi:hypothetical protein
MPNERISMSKLKQLIGLQSSNLRVRTMGRALGLSPTAVFTIAWNPRSRSVEYARSIRVCIQLIHGPVETYKLTGRLPGPCHEATWSL